MAFWASAGTAEPNTSTQDNTVIRFIPFGFLPKGEIVSPPERHDQLTCDARLDPDALLDFTGARLDDDFDLARR